MNLSMSGSENIPNKQDLVCSVKEEPIVSCKNLTFFDQNPCIAGHFHNRW